MPEDPAVLLPHPAMVNPGTISPRAMRMKIFVLRIMPPELEDSLEMNPKINHGLPASTKYKPACGSDDVE
jgi:hypothetical protein